MTNRGMAKSTIEILEKKEYVNLDGLRIDLREELNYCIQNTAFYNIEKLDSLLENQIIVSKFETTIEVVNATSVSTILNECNKTENDKILCLNFASAKNPGGGFISGADAQEESLARTSALYFSQLEAKDFYVNHRNMKSCIYTDAMIYSPKTPVIRKNKGELLSKPVFCNFITSAAVNAGVVIKQEPNLINSIESIMHRRMDKMFSLAYEKGNETLILGAWGCGVFRNDPILISNLFNQHLRGKYKNAFQKIVFAIFTKNEEMLNAFEILKD